MRHTGEQSSAPAQGVGQCNGLCCGSIQAALHCWDRGEATSKQNMGSFWMSPDDSRARLLLRCALAVSIPASVQLNSCR